MSAPVSLVSPSIRSHEDQALSYSEGHGEVAPPIAYSSSSFSHHREQPPHRYLPLVNTTPLIRSLLLSAQQATFVKIAANVSTTSLLPSIPDSFVVSLQIDDEDSLSSDPAVASLLQDASHLDFSSSPTFSLGDERWAATVSKMMLQSSSCALSSLVTSNEKILDSLLLKDMCLYLAIISQLCDVSITYGHCSDARDEFACVSRWIISAILAPILELLNDVEGNRNKLEQSKSSLSNLLEQSCNLLSQWKAFEQLYGASIEDVDIPSTYETEVSFLFHSLSKNQLDGSSFSRLRHLVASLHDSYRETTLDFSLNVLATIREALVQEIERQTAENAAQQRASRVLSMMNRIEGASPRPPPPPPSLWRRTR